MKKEINCVSYFAINIRKLPLNTQQQKLYSNIIMLNNKFFDLGEEIYTGLNLNFLRQKLIITINIFTNWLKSLKGHF